MIVIASPYFSCVVRLNLYLRRSEELNDNNNQKNLKKPKKNNTISPYFTDKLIVVMNFAQ